MPLPLALAVLRWTIGAYFVMSGAANALHFGAFHQQVTTMPLRLWGLGYGWEEGAFVLPVAITGPIAWLLPPLEIAQGVLLAAGVRTREVAASMIAVLLVIVGAFGVFPPELLAPNTMSFSKDLVFVAALLVIAAAAPAGPAATDRAP